MLKLLALDIGGANLKAADGLGYAASRYFPLWSKPEGLAAELATLLQESPPAEVIVATMTGELADCFSTKAEGVSRIVAALIEAAGTRSVRIYLTDGSLVEPAAALARPVEAAASNWHALARLAGRYAEAAASLLVDIGSTTCDVIPLIDGRPACAGRTDPERLASGELVYTGVQRSPVCAIVSRLPWRGCECRVAQELFATTLDAYLTLSDLPEDPLNMYTADGRPATREAARDRLARTICADRTMFADADARAAAETIAAAQCADVAAAIAQVTARMKLPLVTTIVSGEGDFLARRAVERALPGTRIISLGGILGLSVSRVAPAHALAMIAREESLA